MISPEYLSPVAVPALLFQGAVAVADTVVTVQAASTGLRYWVDLLTGIATIIIALALIAIATTVIPAAWYTRRVYGKLDQMVTRVREDFNPVMRHVSAITDNVDYVTTSLRQDVQLLNQTVASANQRVNRVAALAEQRVAELNALLEVVQEEAETLFIDTASTVRGVRTGAEAFRRFRTDAETEDEDYEELDDDALEINVVRKR